MHLSGQRLQHPFVLGQLGDDGSTPKTPRLLTLVFSFWKILSVGFESIIFVDEN